MVAVVERVEQGAAFVWTDGGKAQPQQSPKDINVNLNPGLVAPCTAFRLVRG